jgi:hypothetical protein
MIIPGQFGFNFPSGFREEAFWNIFPIVSTKMAATAGHALTLDPLEKCSNAFFSETTLQYGTLSYIISLLFHTVHAREEI